MLACLCVGKWTFKGAEWHLALNAIYVKDHNCSCEKALDVKCFVDRMLLEYFCKAMTKLTIYLKGVKRVEL